MTSGGRVHLLHVDLPEGWVDHTVYTFQGPRDSGVEHQVTLTVERDVNDIGREQYARKHLDALMTMTQGMELISEGERVQEDGITVYESVCRWTPVDGRTMYRRLVFAVLENRGYYFTAGFSKKTLRTIGLEVDQIIALILRSETTATDDC